MTLSAENKALCDRLFGDRSFDVHSDEHLNRLLDAARSEGRAEMLSDVRGRRVSAVTVARTPQELQDRMPG
jgi:hypothetical protein